MAFEFFAETQQPSLDNSNVDLDHLYYVYTIPSHTYPPRRSNPDKERRTSPSRPSMFSKANTGRIPESPGVNYQRPASAPNSPSHQAPNSSQKVNPTGGQSVSTSYPSSITQNSSITASGTTLTGSAKSHPLIHSTTTDDADKESTMCPITQAEILYNKPGDLQFISQELQNQQSVADQLERLGHTFAEKGDDGEGSPAYSYHQFLEAWMHYAPQNWKTDYWLPMKEDRVRAKEDPFARMNPDIHLRLESVLSLMQNILFNIHNITITMAPASLPFVIDRKRLLETLAKGGPAGDMKFADQGLRLRAMLALEHLKKAKELHNGQTVISPQISTRQSTYSLPIMTRAPSEASTSYTIPAPVCKLQSEKVQKWATKLYNRKPGVLKAMTKEQRDTAWKGIMKSIVEGSTDLDPSDTYPFTSCYAAQRVRKWDSKVTEALGVLSRPLNSASLGLVHDLNFPEPSAGPRRSFTPQVVEPPIEPATSRTVRPNNAFGYPVHQEPVTPIRLSHNPSNLDTTGHLLFQPDLADHIRRMNPSALYSAIPERAGLQLRPEALGSPLATGRLPSAFPLSLSTGRLRDPLSRVLYQEQTRVPVPPTPLTSTGPLQRTLVPVYDPLGTLIAFTATTTLSPTGDEHDVPIQQYSGTQTLPASIEVTAPSQEANRGDPSDNRDPPQQPQDLVPPAGGAGGGDNLRRPTQREDNQTNPPNRIAGLIPASLFPAGEPNPFNQARNREGGPGNNGGGGGGGGGGPGGPGGPYTAQPGASLPYYGYPPTLTYSIDTQIKLSDFPTWDGHEDSALNWIAKIDDRAQHLGKPLRSQLGPAIPDRFTGKLLNYWINLTPAQKRQYGQSWDTICFFILNKFLGEPWQ